MVKEKLVLRKEIKIILKKVLYIIIIFLLGMIAVKKNPSLKEDIDNIVYKESPNYIKAKKIYKKYFSSINENDTKSVFSEKLSYKKQEQYNNGVKLTVTDNYLVPILETGIITYLDSNKVLISQVNGISTEYSNVKISNYKLYDYLEKGKLLGETLNNELYLRFEKDGKYLDYKKYI